MLWQAEQMSRWLDNVLVAGALGRVHSLFDRAANLAFGDRLLAIHDQAMGAGPLAITVKLPPGGLRALAWSVGDAAVVRGDFLWVRSTALHLVSPRWDPLGGCLVTPPDPLIVAANAERLAAFLLACGRPGGMLGAVRAWFCRGGEGGAGPSDGSGSFGEGATMARGSADCVVADGVAAVARGDFAAAPGLVGLGTGLTPSGDDLLAGFLATLVWGQAHRAAHRLFGVLLPKRHRTTAISAAMLQCAAHGGLRERWACLLRDLLTVQGPGALRHAQAAIDVGHTSGTDLCCGLLMGLRFLATSEAGYLSGPSRNFGQGSPRVFAARY